MLLWAVGLDFGSWVLLPFLGFSFSFWSEPSYEKAKETVPLQGVRSGMCRERVLVLMPPMTVNVSMPLMTGTGIIATSAMIHEVERNLLARPVTARRA